MGFESAPLLAVPDATRNALLSHRASAIEYFGDLTGLSELEKAKVWSLWAVAGVSEPFARVPDPFVENQKLLTQVVYNNVMAMEMNKELKVKAEKAALVEAKAKQRQSELVAELRQLRDRLEARNAEFYKAQVELEGVKSQLVVQTDEGAKAQTELEAAQKLLQVRIYTQDQYNEGFENGFKVARRLAFHVDPSINWDVAEEWSMEPGHPNLYVAHDAEVAFLNHLAEAEARDEREAEEAKKKEPHPTSS